MHQVFVPTTMQLSFMRGSSGLELIALVSLLYQYQFVYSWSIPCLQCPIVITRHHSYPTTKFRSQKKVPWTQQQFTTYGKSKSFTTIESPILSSQEQQQYNSSSTLSTTTTASSYLSWTQHPEDDGFRRMRQVLPIRWQHWLRNSGFFRSVIHMLTIFVGAPTFFRTYPKTWNDFLYMSGLGGNTHHTAAEENPLTVIQYGSHPSQQVHLYMPTSTSMQADDDINKRNANSNDSRPWIVFVHGGAWGSGFPVQYRLVALPFLQRQYRVAIIGYRTYPDANVPEQIDDLQLALEAITKTATSTSTTPSKTNDIILIGHSSGAHLILLATLQGRFQHLFNNNSILKGIIGLSGVYDILEHYHYETSRGVEQISPMAPACGGTIDSWIQSSPTRQTQQLLQDSGLCTLPPIALWHGELDTTVPNQSSRDLHASLSRQNVSSSVHILPNIGHSDTVYELILGGRTQDEVLSWVQFLSTFS
jgi:acetyl esterase/lipase